MSEIEMRCIFCKNPSHTSVSIEHVLPKSIGNQNLYLLPGIVCDGCNNYFSREVEKPILSSGIFRLIRSDRQIPTRRGKIPIFDNSEKPNLPDYRIMGRFIGKVGLEVLADRVRGVSGWNDEIVYKMELDDIRNYVRFNSGSVWPFVYRTLYPVNCVFKDQHETFEVLNEYVLLYTHTFELYIILILFGVEFAMNLGGRFFEGYRKWLELHEWESPLYTGKNHEQPNIYYFNEKARK